MPAAPAVRVLVAEDLPSDAELELRELRRAGLDVAARVVSTEQHFSDALREFVPDVILSDFSMPGFDGMSALRLAREFAPEVPFIFVSGTIGEEYAVRALKSGATDYVLKTNLVRLPAAVERALEDARQARERRRTHAELVIAKERLQEREAGLTRAQHMARLAHVVTGADGSFKTWSENLPELISMTVRDMPRSTRQWLKHVLPDDQPLFRQTSIDAAGSGRRHDVSYRLKSGNGDWIYLRQVMEPLRRTEAGEEATWFNTIQDITEQKAAEERVKRLNRVYAVLSGINTLIVRVRERQELFTEACRIAVEHGGFRMAWVGLLDRETGSVKPVAFGGDVGDFFDSAPIGSGQRAGMARRAISTRLPVISADIQNDPQTLMKEQCRKRGINSLAMLPLVVQHEGVGVLALYAAELSFFDEEEMRLLNELAGDISFALDHIAKEEKLNYLALYDGLTGVANRTLFLELLSQQIHAARDGRAKVAVVVSDLERFRAVNDSLGRAAGDLLLGEFTQRLAAVAERDRIARIGPDQFAIAIPMVKNPLEAARRLSELGNACLAQPFHIKGAELRISAKAGLAMFPDDGQDAESLLRNAEAALKRCKQTGERFLFFEQPMTERVAENLDLETRLRRAIEREEFVLHYQPRISLATGRIVGLEALIRWQSDGKLVPPGKFIPLLEETGLILEVGAWALRQAAVEHRAWLHAGVAAPRVAVNVSAVQLRQRDFLQRVKRAVEQGVEPTMIDLEITESMVVEDMAGNIEKLRAIRALGLGIAVDDFGTGYSSLAYLAKLPVTSLKIDRSFIITMLQDRNAMTLVSTMISLGRSLQLKVVAEGVDADEQAHVLRGLDCDEMQGYLFSKPLPGGELVALLRRHSSDDSGQRSKATPTRPNVPR